MNRRIQKALALTSLVLTVTCLHRSAQAQQIVNIDASVYGSPAVGLTPFNVPMSAGTYLITFVDISTPGALYTAWTPYTPEEIWITRLAVLLQPQGEDSVLLSAGTLHRYSTPQEAFADPQNSPFLVTVPEAGFIGFGVSDNIIGDNRGGLSLRIDPISATAPEPSSLALLSLALPITLLRSVRVGLVKRLKA